MEMDGKKNGINELFLTLWRWSKTLPWKELGISEVSSFIHYFVTRYKWEEKGGEKLVVFPRVSAPKGYHLRVSPY
ncbi:cytochrome P450 85A2-like [Brassica napus]|uniref:cytochrome P450 85A2-like n=1 Tax=Brassica napus TaxID=3708 RepID=UPI0020788F65|nr:cytochrome P450 85A2-like [Brassica napus]